MRLVATIDPRPEYGSGGVRHYVRRAEELVRERGTELGRERKARNWHAHLMPSRYPERQVVEHLITVMAAFRRRYRLRRFRGTLTIISTIDYETPQSFWESLADRVEWYDVEAPHHTIALFNTRTRTSSARCSAPCCEDPERETV